MKRWGVPSIFIGRFFGPLRASVPLAAGIFEMPYWRFQFANFVSAFVWSAALLLFGDVIAQIAEWLWRRRLTPTMVSLAGCSHLDVNRAWPYSPRP